MEERPQPQSGPAVPAVRPPSPSVAPAAERSAAGNAEPPRAEGPRRERRRRLTGSRRGAAGLGIVAAALLLWPFADLTLWPWAVGAGLLALLRLLRLHRLLAGWARHLAGLAVVAGLMLATGPWAWALAASVGVLLAGLVQLPRWRLAAVGAALCVVAATGYTLDSVQDARELAEQEAQTSLQNRGLLGAPRATSVLPVLLNSIARGDTGAVCDTLVAEGARPAFAAATGAPDCVAAVEALAAQVVDRNGYARAEAPQQRRGDTVTVDACALSWGGAGPAGPQLGGELTIGRVGQTYVVTGVRRC